MSELREVFEMVTKQTEPDVDAWREQEWRQRRKSWNRRLGALAIAAAIGLAAVVVVIRAADEGTGTQPGGQGTDTNGIPRRTGDPTGVGRDPGVGTVHLLVERSQPRRFLQDLDRRSGRISKRKRTRRRQARLQPDRGGHHGHRGYERERMPVGGTLLGRSAISSAEGVAAALASQKGLRVSTPTDVTVDGFTGTYMERRVPARTDLSGCDLGQFRVYEVPGWGER